MNLRAVFVATLLSCISTQSQAAIIDADAYIYDAPGAATASVNGALNELSFSWSEAAVSFAAEFTSDSTFSIALESLNESYGSNDISGITFDLIDDLGGNVLTRYSLDSLFCESAASEISGSCNLVALHSDARAGYTAYTPGETVFSNFASGTYRLGFYESAIPSSGSAVFSYSEATPLADNAAQVPVPATGLLLLSGFGLMLLCRRRA